jgi:hypothetical protein
MPYLPGYRFDLFISYAGVDNVERMPDDEKSRWVSWFRKVLLSHLNVELGAPDAVTDFWDEKCVRANEPLTRQIADQVASSALLLVLLSRGYLNSDWCRQEREAFLGPDKLPAIEGRVAVIALQALELAAWQPHFLPDLRTYEFHDRNPDTGDVRLLGTPKLLDSDIAKYYERLQRLCRDLALKLSELKERQTRATHGGQPTVARAAAPGVSPADAPQTSGLKPAGPMYPSSWNLAAPIGAIPQIQGPRAAVFLADAGPGLTDEREDLRSYLEQLAFSVLPTSTPPAGSAEFRSATERDVNDAIAFVQLLGPGGETPSAEFPAGRGGLQLECARAHGVPIFRRCPRGFAPAVPTDTKRLSDADTKRLSEFADVQAVGLEEFKQNLRAELQRLLLARREKPKNLADAGGYVGIVAPANDERATALARELEERQLGYEILPEEHRLIDLESPDAFDGMLVVYNTASEGWVRDRVRDCRNLWMKLQKCLRTPPVFGVYRAPEPPERRLLTRPAEFLVLDAGRPLALAPFFERLAARREAARVERPA